MIILPVMLDLFLVPSFRKEILAESSVSGVLMEKRFQRAMHGLVPGICQKKSFAPGAIISRIEALVK